MKPETHSDRFFLSEAFFVHIVKQNCDEKQGKKLGNADGQGKTSTIFSKGKTSSHPSCMY